MQCETCQSEKNGTTNCPHCGAVVCFACRESCYGEKLCPNCADNVKRYIRDGMERMPDVEYT